jgi:hypothetical protein
VTGPQEPRSAAAGHPAPEELSELAFSPETASAALRGHVQDCPSCAAETADLRAVLASLATLPEPALPESVGIRLDAALARAWQQADAEQEAAAGSAAAAPTAASRSRGLWRRLALPLGAVCLIAVAVVGVRQLIGGGSTGSATGPAAGPAVGDTALAQWVHSVVPATASGPKSGAPLIPQIGRGTQNHSMAGVECANAPARAGYTQVADSQREFEGRPATLVVYQNDQEPASRPLFAVVYAGSCPTVSSVVLDQGLVSR